MRNLPQTVLGTFPQVFGSFSLSCGPGDGPESGGAGAAPIVLQHRRDPRLVPWDHYQEVGATDPPPPAESDAEECTDTRSRDRAGIRAVSVHARVLSETGCYVFVGHV